MDAKDLDELRELVDFLKTNGIAQFEMEQDDVKIALSFAPAAGAVSAAPMAAPVAAHAPVAHSAPAMEAAADPHAGQHVVKSPIVGTFYAAPSPDAEPFVKVGDRVEVGTVLCIVEAMKLMNEIESDAAGEVVAVLGKAGQPVEFGQGLFAIK